MIASSVSLLASLGVASGRRTVANVAADASSTPSENDFVEVGVLVSKHGVRGEMLVRSSTDFPKARFENPGLRWLRVPRKGKQQQRLECVELVSGRNRPGKLPCWLIKLKNVTTPDQAAELVGSTMLVKRDERPTLEEGDFYIPDLIGMEVVVKSSGETIGIVEDMFNFGAQDMLRVRKTVDDCLIWIPFVEAIVPEVLLEQRKMIIEPPSGLLELNIPKSKPKPEVRKEELKARRKLQERVSGLRKSLRKSKQEHLLEQINTRDESSKEQKDALLAELLNIDFKSLLDTFHQANDRSKKSECLLSGFTEVPQIQTADRKELDAPETNTARWRKEGVRLISENSVAVVSFTRNSEKLDWLQVQAKHLQHMQGVADLEFPPDAEVKCQIPWFIVTTSESLGNLLTMLKDNEYFGLDETQIILLEQEVLPAFERTETDEEHRIMMLSPWEMARSSTGDGGVLKLLSSENVVNELFEQGLLYLQVYDADREHTRAADPLWFGFAHEQQSELCIQVVPPKPDNDVIGFVNNEAGGYDLVKFSAGHEVEAVAGAATPLGNYVLSVEFLKRFQDSQIALELCTRRLGDAGLSLEYSLLDCLKKCRLGKASFIEEKTTQFLGHA